MIGSTYLNAPKLNKIGFISSNASELRIKQGLDPQTISNVCVYISPKATAYPTNGVPEGAHYDQKNMRDYCRYSSHHTQLNYGIPSIPDNCSCLDYIRSP